MRKDIKFNHLQMKLIIQSNFLKSGLAKFLRRTISKRSQVVLVTDNILYELFGKDLIENLAKEKLDPLHISLSAEEISDNSENLLSNLLDWLDTYTTALADDVLILGLGGSSLLNLLMGAFSILPRMDLFIRPRLWLGFIPTTPKSIFVTTFIGHHTFYLNGKPISVRRYPDMTFVDPSLTSSLPFSKLRTSLVYPLRIALVLSRGLYSFISDLAMNKLLVEYDKLTRNALEIQVNYLVKHCFSKPEDHINLYRFFRVGSFLSYDLRKLPSEERVIYSLLFELYLAHNLNLISDSTLRKIELKLMEYSYMKPNLETERLWEKFLYRISSKIKDERYVGELTLLKDIGKPTYVNMIPLDSFKEALNRLARIIEAES